MAQEWMEDNCAASSGCDIEESDGRARGERGTKSQDVGAEDVRAGMQAVPSDNAGNDLCHRNSRARARLCACFAKTGRKSRAGARQGRSFPRECDDLRGRREGACVAGCALGATFRNTIALVDPPGRVWWPGSLERAGTPAGRCVGRGRDRDCTWRVLGCVVVLGGINRGWDKRGRRVATWSSNRRYGSGVWGRERAVVVSSRVSRTEAGRFPRTGSVVTGSWSCVGGGGDAGRKIRGSYMDGLGLRMPNPRCGWCGAGMNSGRRNEATSIR